MTLDDVLDSGKRFVMISEISRKYNEDPSNPEVHAEFYAYTANCGEIEGPELMLMKRELSKDLVKTRRIIDECTAEEENGLINRVAENYEGILDGLSDEYIKKIAVELPDERKSWVEIIRKIQERDLRGVREAYADTFENKVWKKFILDADERLVNEYAQRFALIHQLRFVKEYLSSGEGEDRVYSPTLAKSYITETMEHMDDETKNAVNRELGLAYFSENMPRAE